MAAKRTGLVWRLARGAGISTLAVVALTVALILPWRWMPPPTTSFMLQAGRLLGEPVRHRWVPWREISPNLAIAVVAAEDQRFPDHRGFDWVQIQDALVDIRQGGRVRGASTISQQVSKNLFLWPGESWARKGVEAYFTVWIEALWPKRRILEVYLNVAEFGTGVFGVGAAAEGLIGTSPGDLTPWDAAVLTAVLPSPARMSAARPSDYVRSRATEIMRSVEGLGGTSYLEGI